MPWKESSTMSLRREFISLVLNNGSNISKLCQRFGISRKTGYKWIYRFIEEGFDALADQSRRPNNSPNKTPESMEKSILKVRQHHPTWGGRKIKRRLEDLGEKNVPSPSTITAILHRYGLIQPEESIKHTRFQRFERGEPNDLWQMDFKGYVPCPEGLCHPLTVLDDCSRYAIALKACSSVHGKTVKQHLIEAFRCYGLPRQLLVDNGPPWGAAMRNEYTCLTVWCIRLGIHVIHSSPGHPQTVGKGERFHRTLKAELVGRIIPWRRPECQRRFDQWRVVYNCERPHEALNMQVPASRYQVSVRPYPERLPEIEYSPDDEIRKVQQGGWLDFKGKQYRLPKALYGQRVALRPNLELDGIIDVFFCQQNVAHLDLRSHE